MINLDFDIYIHKLHACLHDSKQFDTKLFTDYIGIEISEFNLKK